MGKDFAEGSAGIGAGFSSRHGALCALPTADSAQSPAQAGPCCACPCAGHTHTEHTFPSRSTSQRSPCLLLPALRARLRGDGGGGTRPGDWLRGSAGGGTRAGDWLRGPAGGGAAPFPCALPQAPAVPPARGQSAALRCSLMSLLCPCGSASPRTLQAPPLTFHLPGIPRSAQPGSPGGEKSDR